jgi:cell division septum initiation protein DivIVA
VLDHQDADRQIASQGAEVADRAGAIVTEQIRAIIEHAEANAVEIRAAAERDAEAMTQRAAESAARMLERINALDGPLSALVAELQREAEGLAAEPETRDFDEST